MIMVKTLGLKDTVKKRFFLVVLAVKKSREPLLFGEHVFFISFSCFAVEKWRKPLLLVTNRNQVFLDFHSN